jgi:hypothetical protein
MAHRFALIFALALGLAACKKDNDPVQPAPVAGFSVTGTAAADVITVGTYDLIQVANTSANAASYAWALGNDSTKTGFDPGLLRYPKAGTYTLTLTAQSASGQKASASRTVKVLDRVIKQVVVLGTRFENVAPPHLFPSPTAQAVLRLGPNRTSYPFPTNPYASYDAPIVFQSPLVPNLTDTQFPLVFNVPGKLVLDFAALNVPPIGRNLGGYTGVGYGLELYVQDATGTYLASSSYQAVYRPQAGSITWRADIQKNTFIAQYSNVQLVCDYE